MRKKWKKFKGEKTRKINEKIPVDSVFFLDCSFSGNNLAAFEAF